MSKRKKTKQARKRLSLSPSLSHPFFVSPLSTFGSTPQVDMKKYSFRNSVKNQSCDTAAFWTHSRVSGPERALSDVKKATPASIAL